MKKSYVLDACALIACLSDEEGAGVVQNILDMARHGKCKVFMHAVNLLEVYYGVRKEYGEIAAKEMFEGVMEESIAVCSDISESIIFEAGRRRTWWGNLSPAHKINENSAFATIITKIPATTLDVVSRPTASAPPRTLNPK